jgi:hypothetical protein
MRIHVSFVLIMLPLSALLAAQEKPAPNVFKRLPAAAEVNHYPCAPGAAWFYAGGQLRTCRLARDASFGEALAPAGSWIYLLENGAPSYVFLSGNTNIHGHVCRGVGHDLITSLYPGGQLRTCWLATDEEIQDVPCMQTTFFGKFRSGDRIAASFYENGRLKSCKVSRDALIQGVQFRRGEQVVLDAQGKIVNPT